MLGDKSRLRGANGVVLVPQGESLAAENLFPIHSKFSPPIVKMHSMPEQEEKLHVACRSLQLF